MHRTLGLDVVPSSACLMPPAGLRGGQRVDDVDGAGEQHRVPALASGVAQGRHQMALAQADAGDEHDVGVLGDEVQVEQVLDLRPVDLGGPVPVELVEVLSTGKRAWLDAALHAPILARGGLTVEQLAEVVQVRPVLVGGGRAPAAGSSRA